MRLFILKRILTLVPTFFGILIITFAVMHLAPGDPSELIAQNALNAGGVSAGEIIDKTRAGYGLDKPIHAQFFLWLRRAVALDFGNSYRDNRPVIKKIWEALPVTILLNSLSIFLIYLISIPLGVYASRKAGGLFDRISSIGTMVLYSLPVFWVAMMLIILFAGGDFFNWFPIAGIMSDSAANLPWYGFAGNVFWHLVLPIACLVYGGFAYISRMVRSSMLDVLRQDFIMTAYAKGLSVFDVMVRHAFRNAIIPIVTLFGMLLPAMISGSVIVEQIFSIPGMGRLGFESVLARDYPVIMGITTMSAFLTLAGLLLSDILYTLVDPRITFEAGK